MQLTGGRVSSRLGVTACSAQFSLVTGTLLLSSPRLAIVLFGFEHRRSRLLRPRHGGTFSTPYQIRAGIEASQQLLTADISLDTSGVPCSPDVARFAASMPELPLGAERPGGPKRRKLRARSANQVVKNRKFSRALVWLCCGEHSRAT